MTDLDFATACKNIEYFIQQYVTQDTADVLVGTSDNSMCKTLRHYPRGCRQRPLWHWELFDASNTCSFSLVISTTCPNYEALLC